MNNKKHDSEFEIIDGVKYINGFRCSDSGRPITVSNGYSEEDEKEAAEAYKTAKENAHYSSLQKVKKTIYYESVKPKRRATYVAPLEDERWK